MHVDLRGEHRGRVSVLLAAKMSAQGRKEGEVCARFV